MEGGPDVKTPDTERKLGKRFGTNYEAGPEEKRRKDCPTVSENGFWQQQVPVKQDRNRIAFENLARSGFLTQYDENKGLLPSAHSSVEQGKVVYMFVMTKGSNLDASHPFCDIRHRTERTVVVLVTRDTVAQTFVNSEKIYEYMHKNISVL